MIWTRHAEDHVQRIFSKLDEYSPRIAETWLDELGNTPASSLDFRRWRPSGVRHIGVRSSAAALACFTSSNRRLIVSGIFPLSMDPATIHRRLEDTDWV